MAALSLQASLSATTRHVVRSTDADNIRPTWPDIIPIALRANLKPFVYHQPITRHPVYLEYGSSDLISNIIP